MTDGPTRLQSRIRARIRAWRVRWWTSATRTVSYGPARRQVLDVMRPRGRRSACPVVVAFHGGGWIEGSRASLVDRVCRRYLERGFVVVNVEYRAGLSFASADARAALAWTFDHIASYGGDPERVVVTGESAGGQLALMAAFSCHRQVRAAINFYAATDLVGYSHGHPDQTWPGIDELRRLSPLELVTPDVCPVLSIHGSADMLVPVDHAVRLTHRLQQAGITTQQWIVEGAEHGFTQPELDAAYERVFRFVDRAVSAGASRRPARDA